MLVYDVWLLCDASMHGASTQPKLTVLPHAYRVLVCCCVVVLLCCCVVVLLCCCVVVLLCWCVVVLVGVCVGVLWCCGVGVWFCVMLVCVGCPPSLS